MLIAGGPSLTLSQIRMIGMAHAKGLINVIAINDAVYPAWFADMAYACDERWWRHHEGLLGFEGLRVSLEVAPYRGMKLLQNTGTEGFDPEPGCIRTGGNSGYQALHLCAHLGVKTAILVGYDMKGSHWFGEHPTSIRSIVRGREKRVQEFSELKQALDALPMEVINATIDTAIGCFQRMSLEDALNHVEIQNGR